MLAQSSVLDFKLFTHNPEIDEVSKVFLTLGKHDVNINNWLINNVKPGWVVYDVGAHIFEITEICARLAGKDGHVFSFEPQQHLVKNYVLKTQKVNSYDNVAKIHIYPYGLASYNGKAELSIPESNTGSASFDDKFIKQRDSQNNLTNLPIYVKRADSLNLMPVVPDLIKLDIEGSEPSFWIGTPEFLKKAKHIIVELGHYTEDWFFEELISNRSCYDLNRNEFIYEKPFNQTNCVMSLNN